MKKLKNTQLTANGFDFLLAGDHQNVVRGVLKKLGQRPCDTSYPDLFQEGCLAFVQAYVEFHHRPITADDPNKACLGFAYRRVYWRLMDMLLHQTLIGSRCLSGDQLTNVESQTLLESLVDEGDSVDSYLERHELWRLIYLSGSLNERRYLNGLLVDHLTGRQIASKYNVTPQTVSGWRRQVIDHARLIYGITDNRTA